MFLNTIEGQKSEDLTTCVLSYILQQPINKSYRKILLNHIFPHKYFSEINQFDNLLINTQVELNGFGRADLVVENEDVIIIIENKFYAEFSGGDQIKCYVDYLKNDTRRIKCMCLLALSEREKYYTKCIKDMYGIRAVQNNIDVICDYLKGYSIDFSFISWEKLLDSFSSDYFLIKELKNYIYHNYLTDTTLLQSEIEMINKDEIPVLMEKIWNSIDKVKTHLSSDGYNTKRTSQSRIFYGFPIEEKWGQIWLEYYHNPWIKYKTPFIIHIREEWINSEYKDISKDIIILLISIGFIKDNDLGYLYLVRIEKDDLVGNLLEITKEIINKIRNGI